ncbi:protein lin-41 [Folsomia candida]|uniref:E3 ubiquitin-protein ligase TRIM71 n=1 Tax=Folsomia candida TaxID=158441 RepID=A0A226E4W8_FOLCA|nr:protein lin-41 [Folsomia candida]OXA52489.1 hypothetical protein Fcan01_12634 [Folsomia candida]
MHLNLPLLDLLPCYSTDEELCLDSGYNTTNVSPSDPSPPSPWDDEVVDWTSLSFELNRLLEESTPVDIEDNISLSLPDQSFLTSEDATVLLTAQDPATQDDLKRLTIVIVGPNNNVALPILNCMDVGGSGILYIFRPVIPGIYTVTICHDATQPIRGCPLRIRFSRNYQPSIRRILTWNISDMEQSSGLRNPWGICYNTKTEQLWVADRVNHTLIVYQPDGSLDFIIGQFGAGPGEFFRPVGLAYDVHSDRIFVSDKDNHRIQILNAKDGSFLGAFGRRGHLAGQFLYPWGIAISPDGSTVAVADTRNHRIQFFDAAGTYLREFRVGGNWKEHKSVFNYPRGLAFNLTGEVLFVSDFNLHQVNQLRFTDAKLTLLPFIPPGILYRPSGLQVDEAGNLIVADTRNNVLRVFTPTGILIRTITTIHGPLYANANTSLSAPTDVAILPKTGFIAALDNDGRITVF